MEDGEDGDEAGILRAPQTLRGGKRAHFPMLLIAVTTLAGSLSRTSVTGIRI